MTDERGRFRTLSLAALLAVFSSTANAAFFNVETQVGPQTATVPQEVGAGCRTDGYGNGDAFVSADGQRVVVYANTVSSVEGDACSDILLVNINSSEVLGQIDGPAGETVSLCVSARVLQDAAADGEGFLAESVIGSGFVMFPPVDPMEFLVNGTPVFSFGPNILTDTSVSESFNDEITVSVGDTIEVRTLAAALASVETGGPFSGFASARARGEISLALGGCGGVMAPVASPWGLAGLATFLGLLGVLRAAPPRR